MTNYQFFDWSHGLTETDFCRMQEGLRKAMTLLPAKTAAEKDRLLDASRVICWSDKSFPGVLRYTVPTFDCLSYSPFFAVSHEGHSDSLVCMACICDETLIGYPHAEDAPIDEKEAGACGLSIRGEDFLAMDYATYQKNVEHGMIRLMEQKLAKSLAFAQLHPKLPLQIKNYRMCQHMEEASSLLSYALKETGLPVAIEARNTHGVYDSPHLYLTVPNDVGYPTHPVIGVPMVKGEKTTQDVLRAVANRMDSLNRRPNYPFLVVADHLAELALREADALDGKQVQEYKAMQKGWGDACIAQEEAKIEKSIQKMRERGVKDKDIRQMLKRLMSKTHAEAR